MIGSDQVASLDGRLLRKPGSAEVAVAQLRACQGKTVLFHTAVAVIATDTGETLEHVDRTEVQFRRLDVAALEQYVRLEQPARLRRQLQSRGARRRVVRADLVAGPDGAHRTAADLRCGGAQEAGRRSAAPLTLLVSSAVSTALRSSGNGALALNGSPVSGHSNDSECACRNIRCKPNDFK